MFLSNIMSCNSVLYKLFSKPFWKKEVLRLERTFLCSIIQMYIYLTIKCLNQWKYKVSMLCIPKIEKIYTNCVYLPNMQNFWFRALLPPFHWQILIEQHDLVMVFTTEDILWHFWLSWTLFELLNTELRWLTTFLGHLFWLYK